MPPFDPSQTTLADISSEPTVIIPVETESGEVVQLNVNFVQGPPGKDGNDGVDGSDGPKGDTGPKGDPGPPGKDGVDGVDGAGGFSKVIIVPTATIYDAMEPLASEILLHIEGVSHNYVPVVPAASIPIDGGYRGATATVTPDGEVTITNVETPLSDSTLYVFHYFVRIDNMLGKTLSVKRSTQKPDQHGGDLLQWQMAYAYDPHNGPWLPFDNVSATTWTLTAANNTPCTQGTVYVARRPVFTSTRWDTAIERWRLNPHTSPTASGNAQFVVGTLPANQYAPAMDVYGFKFGAGPTAIVMTGNVHTGEHIGAFAMEAAVDWLLSDDPRAVNLRTKCTFYVYPKFNPQGRYAGAQRAETELLGGDMNSNRIWWPEADFNHVPLSKVMRDAFRADLPAKVASSYDFHDTAINTAQNLPHASARGYLFEYNSGKFTGSLRAEYRTRTGVDITSVPSGGGPTLGAYFRNAHNTDFGMAVEHQISSSVGVSEWQEWGRDVGRAMHNFYGDNPKWITPEWLPLTDTTVTEDNGDIKFTRALNPGAAFKIPDGKTIEILFDLRMTTATALFLRQSLAPNMAVSDSDALYQRNSSAAPLFRVQQVTWKANRPYVGVIISTGTSAATLTATNMTKYRVLP